MEIVGFSYFHTHKKNIYLPDTKGLIMCFHHILFSSIKLTCYLHRGPSHIKQANNSRKNNERHNNKTSTNSFCIFLLLRLLICAHIVIFTFFTNISRYRHNKNTHSSNVPNVERRMFCWFKIFTMRTIMWDDI